MAKAVAARVKAKPRKAKKPEREAEEPTGAAESVKTLADAESEARSIVNNWSLAAAAASWLPKSTLVLGAADYAMIRSVATVFGVKRYSKEAIVGIMAGCCTGKMAASSILRLLPGPGWLLRAGLAGSITKAMGEAVISYFRQRSPLASGS